MKKLTRKKTVILILTTLIILPLAWVSLALNEYLNYAGASNPHIQFVEQKVDIKKFQADYAIFFLSDIQWRDEEEYKQLRTVLKDVITVATSIPNAEKIVIIGGDVTQNGLSKQISRVERMEKDWAIPTYKICGNHDIDIKLNPRGWRQNCARISRHQESHYIITKGNLQILFLSSGTPESETPKRFQASIPESSIAFLSGALRNALAKHNTIFIVAPEKPKGIATFRNPLHPYSGVASTATLMRIFDQLPKEDVCGESGFNIIYFSGDDHTPTNWFQNLIVKKCILYVSIPSVRTNQNVQGEKRYTVSYAISRIFNIKIQPSNVEWKTIGKLNRIFPWPKYSAGRVLLLNRGSNKITILTRNFSHNKWYDFFYIVTMRNPFHNAE